MIFRIYMSHTNALKIPLDPAYNTVFFPHLVILVSVILHHEGPCII